MVVLVAEDNKTNQKLMLSILKRCGYIGRMEMKLLSCCEEWCLGTKVAIATPQQKGLRPLADFLFWVWCASVATLKQVHS